MLPPPLVPCSSARSGRLPADQDAELVVGRAVAVRAEALAGRAGRRARRRSGSRPSRSSSSVGTRRNTGRPIAATRAERAAQQDVVALVALALGVAHGRALEAEIADPVLAAGVGAAVEVQPELRDLVAEPALEVLDQGAEASLRLGDGEVAVRLAGAADRVRAQPVGVDREADLAPARPRRALDVGDPGDDEVLLARQADVAALRWRRARRRRASGRRRSGRGERVHRPC